MSERVARRIERSPAGISEKRQFKDPGMPERQARRIRTRPLVWGEELILIPEDHIQGRYCTVQAPDKLILVFPPERGPVEIWLLQSGIWTYRWGDGDEHTFEVPEQLPIEDAVDKQSTEVKIDPQSLPSMTVTRKPRF